MAPADRCLGEQFFAHEPTGPVDDELGAGTVVIGQWTQRDVAAPVGVGQLDAQVQPFDDPASSSCAFPVRVGAVAGLVQAGPPSVEGVADDDREEISSSSSVSALAKTAFMASM